MYGVGIDISRDYNICSAEWVNLCHWLDGIRDDPTYLSSQCTTPLTGESTKAEYRVMLTYTGSRQTAMSDHDDEIFLSWLNLKT